MNLDIFISDMAGKIVLLDRYRDRLECMGRQAHDDICPKCQMRDHLRYWETLLDERVAGVSQGAVYEIERETGL